jgi:cephalosporin-C deacetylase-like acetyl esterase
MAYFDPVFAAKRVRCPVEITRAGLGDYVCAPSSFAVLYNVLQVPKKITWNQGWTHGWSPSGMDKWTIDGGFAAAVAQEGKASSPAAAINSGTLAN